MTSKTEILDVVATSMLSRNNVLNVETDEREIGLSQAAILAMILGTIPHITTSR